MSVCKNGLVRLPSREWEKDGKPQYYCHGWIDKMTDELLPECKACNNHVSRAQEDLENWKKERQI